MANFHLLHFASDIEVLLVTTIDLRIVNHMQSNNTELTPLALCVGYQELNRL